jgi:hypothetical protein
MAGAVLTAVLAGVLTGAIKHPALGVFFGLEVLDFDRFLGFIPFLHD